MICRAVCLLFLAAWVSGANTDPIMISVKQVLDSPSVRKDGYQKFVEYKRPNYSIRFWSPTSAETRPSNSSPHERLLCILSGRLITIDGQQAKEWGPGSIWKLPPGLPRPPEKGDMNSPAIGFTLLGKRAKKPSRSVTIKFRNVYNVMKKHPLPEGNSVRMTKVFRSARFEAYVEQLRGASPVTPASPGERVFYVLEGSVAFRLPKISYGASPGMFIVIPAGNSYSINSRGTEVAKLLSVWVRPYDYLPKDNDENESDR